MAQAKRKQSDTSKPGDNTTHTEPSSKRANAGAKATTADKVSTSSSKGKAALIKTMPASSTAQTVSKSATATATPRSDEEDYRRGHSSGSELRIVSPPGQAKKQSSKGKYRAHETSRLALCSSMSHSALEPRRWPELKSVNRFCRSHQTQSFHEQTQNH